MIPRSGFRRSVCQEIDALRVDETSFLYHLKGLSPSLPISRLARAVIAMSRVP